MIGEWYHFVLFKVMPTASAQILIWLHDWQVLAVGLVLLFAGTVWTRAILRSNQRTGYLISQSLKIMTEAFAESSRQYLGESAVPHVSSRSAEPGAPPQPDEFDTRLDRLRAIIRGALSVIPQSNERVDGNIAQLLRNISNFSLEGQGERDMNPAQAQAMGEMEKCIGGLKSAQVDSMRCSEAWDALVRLHRAARILRDGAYEAPQNQAA